MSTHVADECPVEGDHDKRQRCHSSTQWDDDDSSCETPSVPGEDDGTRDATQDYPSATRKAGKDFWREKRQQRRARRKEHRAEVQKVQQSTWETLTEEEKAAKKAAAAAVHEARRRDEAAHTARCQSRLEHPQTPQLVFDCSFAEHMKPNDIKSTLSQIRFAYSSCRRSAFPFRCVFTSVEGKFDELRQYRDFHHYPPVIESQPWWKTISLDRIVYLTADSDSVLQTIEPNTSYVIGTFVDHNSKKGLTLALAKAHGVRTARLPLDETLGAVGNLCKVLTVNAVVGVLCRFTETNSWTEAFKVLPTRRK